MKTLLLLSLAVAPMVFAAPKVGDPCFVWAQKDLHGNMGSFPGVHKKGLTGILFCECTNCMDWLERYKNL